MNSDKKLMAAEHLYDLQVITDPQISPDGKNIIFSVQRVDRGSEKKYSNLWIVPADGGDARQFTYGNQTDRHARWSPDGREIAFLSNRQDEKQQQIYIIPFLGGEARPLTELNGSFGGFEWSPNGKTLVLQFRSKDDEVIEREADEQKKKLGIVARQITRLDYKAEGGGFLPQEKWHIWTVDKNSGESKQLTEGEYNDIGPRWSPDGSQILFISNRSPRPDKDIDATDLFLIPAGGGKATKIPAPYGRKFAPSFSADGQWIAYIGREKSGAFYQNNSLYILPVSGGKSCNLTHQYDLHIETATIGDIDLSEGLNLPVWSLDGRFIYVAAAIRGDQPLLAIPVNEEDGEPQRVIEEPGVVGGFSFDDSQDRIAALWSFLSSTGQIAIKEQNNSGITILTQFNQDLLAQMELGEIEEVTFTGPGGDALDGWILKPPGFDPQKQYPSILEIHGGPQTQYGRVFMHEFYYLAAQGFVIYWCNPRGSQGYGESFSGAIFNNWGTVDFDDIMAWVDYVAEKPYIDPSRMGIAGGSYGGYMTIWVISHTDRFNAAVAQRLVSNLISFYGSSDMNILSEHLFGTQAPPWEDIENYWRHSPMSAVGNATTPTMIMHSLGDFRVASEQGEQVFVALQQKGVDSELVLFPEESHGLSRNGRTDRRVARLEHMARWFEKYLKQN